MEKKITAAGLILSATLLGIWAVASSNRPPVPGVGLAALPDAAVRTTLPTRVPTPPTSAPLQVVFHDGLLTLDVRDARLHDVVDRITAATGVTFAFASEPHEQVSLELRAVPWEQAVAALLQQAGYSYAAVADGRGAQRWLVARRGDAQAPQPSGQADPASPSPDPSLLQQQRATDALLQACKASVCDSS